MAIRNKCPGCSGEYEFDESEAGELRTCPTCQGVITLEVAVSAAPTLPPSRLTLDQKIWRMITAQNLTVSAALLLLIVSLFTASWEVAFRPTYGAPVQIRVVRGSVFEPPVKFSYHEEVVSCRLMIAPLAVAWIALGAVTAGALWLIKKPRSAK